MHIYTYKSRQDFITGIGGSDASFFEKAKRVPQTTPFFALKLLFLKYAELLLRVDSGISWENLILCIMLISLSFTIHNKVSSYSH